VANDFDELTKIFLKIKKESHHDHNACRMAYQHHQKNRHPSFLPFDKNRTLREAPGFYLSASDVTMKESRYILAQAPIAATVKDFFFALIKRKSPLIVTLVMPIEHRVDKCYPFWDPNIFPIKARNWIVDREGDETVLFTSEKKEGHRIVRRHFKCTNRTSGRVHLITQLHYENWPDNGTPCVPLFLRLLRAVEAEHTSSELPITVHCSAGVGRTGTFVAAHAIRKMLQKNLHVKLDIPKEILTLRSQRHSLIANPKQLRCVYKAVTSE